MKSNGEHFHWLFPLAGSPGWKLFQLTEQGQKSLWDLSSLMPVISVSGCCSSCVTCRDFSKIKLWGWMVRLPFASSAVSLSWYHLSYRNVLRKETGHQESIGASVERQTYLQTLLTLLHFRNMLWVTTREKGKKAINKIKYALEKGRNMAGNLQTLPSSLLFLFSTYLFLGAACFPTLRRTPKLP